ncbi:MAG: A/G-specific adenine glycosylase, partial [Patescibacteria group bacterium]
YIHYFFPKRRRVDDKEIFALVEKTLDRKNPREWYWALMDYGAMLGTLKENPNKKSAHYRRQPPFRGSRRELRGKVIQLLTARKALSPLQMQKILPQGAARLHAILRELENEGFTKTYRRKIMLKT